VNQARDKIVLPDRSLQAASDVQVFAVHYNRRLGILFWRPQNERE
jgi:hypothetical protein